VTYSAMGLGAALSNIYAGYLVKAFGYNTGFACLGIAGFLAFLFFLFLIKETRDLNIYN
jgi:sugar phosphate permease